MLEPVFDELNAEFFHSFLDRPIIRYNPRLRTSAGRFFPGSRKYPELRRPVIEIASYLVREEKAALLIRDTMGHEMIHYWLWSRRRPYGHNAEFWELLRQLGVSRYNPVPKQRPFKYAYRCGNCNKEFLTRKRLGALACAVCCKQHSNGKYHPSFKLQLERTIAEPPKRADSVEGS